MFRDSLTPDLLARSSNRPHRFRPSVEALEDRTMAVATSTTLMVSPGRIFAGQPIVLTAFVSATGSPDRGPVSFFDGSKMIGQIQNVNPAGGQVSIVVTLAAGPHSLTARFEGSANADPSTSAAVSVNVVNGLQNITGKISVTFTPLRRGLFGLLQRVRVTIQNTSGEVLQGPFFVLLPRFPRGLGFLNRFGFSFSSIPGFFGRRFVQVNLAQINPGQTFSFGLTLLGSLPRRPLLPVIFAGQGPF